MTQVVATGQLPLAGVVVPGETEHLAIVRELVALTWLIGRRDGRQETRHEVKFDQPEEGPLPQHALAFLGARQAMQGKWSRDLDAEVTKVLVHSMSTGADVRTTMRALQRVFPEFGKARLENIARTEATTAYNAGRLAAFQEDTDFVTGVQFHAILDSRTTTICQARNGLILRLDDQRLPANTPPLHYQCRSVLVPVDRIAWRKLEAGDKKAEAAFFGYLEGGPANLDAALAGWDNTPAPLPGFGTVDGRTADQAGGKFDRVKLPSNKDEATKNAIKGLHETGLIDIESSALKSSEYDVRAGFNNKLGRVEDKIDEVLARYPATMLDLLREDGVRVRVVAKLDPLRDPSGKVIRGGLGRYDGSTRSITVTAGALHADEGVLDEELYHAWDHLFGSRGTSDRLSEGKQSAFPKLAKLGKTTRARFDSGEDFLSDYMKSNPREFLAQLALDYATQDSDGRKVLRDLVPEMYTVVERLFFNKAFMDEALR